MKILTESNLLDNERYIIIIKELTFKSSDSDTLHKLRELGVIPSVTETNVGKAAFASVSLGAKAGDRYKCVELLKPLLEKMCSLLGECILEEKEYSLEDYIMEKLVHKNMRISTAESCTGGKVAAKLINYPGASNCIDCGFVTYSNEAKEKYLNVSRDTLEKYGAVSSQTALEMAEGVARQANAHVGISTTGIAGPSGGTSQKPVGLVYVGIYIEGKSYFKKLLLKGERNVVRDNATKEALLFLAEKLQ